MDRVKIDEMVRRCDELIDLAIRLKASLEALRSESSNRNDQATIVQEFPMHSPDALNRGPLRWLLRKLEEEASKGHIEAWHSLNATAVRFTVRLKPEATPEDRKKLDRWFSWVRKRLAEGRQK